METITKWKTIDGQEFNVKAEAEEHEAHLITLHSLRSVLQSSGWTTAMLGELVYEQDRIVAILKNHGKKKTKKTVRLAA